MFAKVYGCFLKIYRYLIFYQKYCYKFKYPAGYPVSGPYRISGIRPIPDIRYPAHTGYPVSGKNSIRCIPAANSRVRQQKKGAITDLNTSTGTTMVDTKKLPTSYYVCTIYGKIKT
jgi:hypothetical protein